MVQASNDYTTSIEFILSSDSLSDYCELLDAAEDARRHAANGIIQLTNRFDKLYNDYFIYMLNNDKIITTYLDKLSSFDDQKKEIPKEINMMPIIENVTKSIESITSWPKLLNHVNLLVSISASMAQFNDDRCISNIIKVCKHIFHHKDTYQVSLNNIYSLLTFLFTHFSFYSYDVRIKNGFDAIDSSFFGDQVDHDFRFILISLKNFILNLKNTEGVDMITITKHLMDCPPLWLHPNLHWILHIIKNNKELKLPVIQLILQCISIIASGTDNNLLLLSNVKPLAYSDLSTVTHCKTPNHLLICCNELICFCRQLLEDKDQDMLNIISYILTAYNPDPSIKNTANSNELKLLFDNDSYLFAVFAILSNSINCIHQNSLIQLTEQNTVFYIDQINYSKSLIYAWALPFNINSVRIELAFSSVSPLSLISFSPSLYSETHLLLPYFFTYLEKDIPDYLLSIYIFQSLLGYFEDNRFATLFFEKFKASPINLTYLKKQKADPRTILKRFLTVKHERRSIATSQIVTFNLATPYSSIKNCTDLIRKDYLISNTSSIVFISSVLSLSKTGCYFLSIDATNTLIYDVGLIGLYMPSSSFNYFVYSKREKEGSSICESQTITTIKPLICYDQNTQQIHLFDHVPKKKLYTKEITDDLKFAFIVVLYGKVFVKYSVSQEIPDGYESYFSHPSKTLNFESIHIPNIVFRRKQIQQGIKPISVSHFDINK